MTAKTYWLISYRYEACFKYATGLRSNAPNDAVEPYDGDPGQFVLDTQNKLMALQDAPYDPSKGPQRADKVLLIYSAFQIDRETYKQLCEVI